MLSPRSRVIQVLATAVAASMALPAQSDPAYLGGTGLLRVPIAQVIEEGRGTVSIARHNPDPQLLDAATLYTVGLGFWKRVEVSSRLVEGRQDAASGIRDLSADLKVRLLGDTGGPALAAGMQDYGGQNDFFRTRYLVASLPWSSVETTIGYGERGSALDGWFGGMQWRPADWISLLMDRVNGETLAGVRWSGGGSMARANLTLSYGFNRRDVEFGISLAFPLGDKSESRAAGRAAGMPQVAADRGDETLAGLADAYAEAGFESVRLGTRADGTVLAVLENRRFNHSAVDGAGVALAMAADHLPPGRNLELVFTRYEVPQIAMTQSVDAWREALQSGETDGVPQAWQVEPVRQVADSGSVRWIATRAPMQAIELIAEPVVRTFVGTEVGVLDAALGARLRTVMPLAPGLLVAAGAELPLAATDDLRAGGEFEAYAPEAGIDHALFQYFHKPLPSWSWLWSFGRTQVFRSDLRVAALEQQWLSPAGRHQLRLKLMQLDAVAYTSRVALGGYTWFDAARRYSVSATGGRFYAGDNGGRLELNRHFGDTLVGLYWRVAGRYEQAAGVQFSLPLTPRRDPVPRTVQFKGASRWSYNLGTTVNAADGSNLLRPLLLYEPTLDLDLRRDFFDGGRLTPDYFRANVERMLEAAGLATD